MKEPTSRNKFIGRFLRAVWYHISDEWRYSGRIMIFTLILSFTLPTLIIYALRKLNVPPSSVSQLTAAVGLPIVIMAFIGLSIWKAKSDYNTSLFGFIQSRHPKFFNQIDEDMTRLIEEMRSSERRG